MEVIEVVKKHPLAIGAGVVVLLLLMMRGGGSTDTGNNALINASLKSQETAGRTDIALSSINAQAAAARTSVIGGLWEKTILANTQRAIATGQNQAQLIMAGLAHQENLTQIEGQLDVAHAQVTAAQATAAQQINAQITMANNAASVERYRIDAMGAAAHEAISLDWFRSEQAANLQRYSMDLTSANLPQILQSQQANASIAASNAQALAAINGQTAQAIAALNRSAGGGGGGGGGGEDSGGDYEWVGTVATIAAAFFSDRRLKKNIEQIGVDNETSLAIYTYEYLNGDFGCGPMADEVAYVRPEAVINHPSGYAMVMPGAM